MSFFSAFRYEDMDLSETIYKSREEYEYIWINRENNRRITVVYDRAGHGHLISYSYNRGYSEILIAEEEIE